MQKLAFASAHRAARMPVEFRIEPSCGRNDQALLRKIVAASVLLIACVPVFAQRPQLVLQTGHPGGPSTIAFSADGNLIASSGSDDTIQLWETSTGRGLRTLRTFERSVVAFGVDGRTILAVSGTALKEWDITTGQELRSLQFANPGNTFGSAFGPGKRIYATGGDDTIVRLWDTNTGRMLKALPSSPMKIYGLAFSDDGKTLVAGGYDATLRLWDAASGAPRSVVVRSGIVSWVALHPAATSIAAGAVLDKKIRLWDAKTGALLRTLAGHTDAVKYAIFSPDGNKLASLANDKTVRIWHPATGELLRDLKGESPITFNADGSLLAVRTEGDITLLDTVTGVAVRTLRSRTEAAAKIAFSPDGKMLAYSNRGRQRTVQLWNISSGREHSTLRGEQAAVSSESVAFSPDSRSIVSGATFTTAKIWDAQSGVEKVTIGERSTTGSPTSELGNPIIYAPDGQFLISVASTGWVTLWNALTGKSLGKFSASRAEFNAIAVSPDGRSLATAGYGKGTLSQGGVALWDMGTGRIRTTLSHPGVIETVAFSPDGGKLASSGADGTIRLWNVVTGTPVRVIKASTEEIRAVAFTPDGSKLVSGGRDAMIRVFDAVTGAQLHALPTGSYGVFSLAVSTDGRLAASGDFDAGVKLWDLATGRELARVLAIDERDWLVITPDGLFDGSPGAWPLVMWRFGTNTFDVLPAEAFFNEFFHPGLLADLLEGRRPVAALDIAARDRRQAQLRISAPTGPAAKTREIVLTIDVLKAQAGAQDVRLFRNGSLVAVWHGDVLKGARSVRLNTRATLVAGENRFTTYAFNRDNVKSSDVSLTVTGDVSLKRPGNSWLLAVGVDQYANANFNLKYAAADARFFAAGWKYEQEMLRKYGRVEALFVSDQDATKQGILRDLTAFVERSQPEDTLALYFAGHGIAHESQFYLVPHDLGYAGTIESLDEVGLRRILSRSISDSELEQAFEKIDAGRILLVIDACNSGQALEAAEKRRGPMNSRGLAQLAYEKGMYVLTAAQSHQAAIEVSRLGHGLLTYALVEEGLRKRLADMRPRDHEIRVAELFDYASERVPHIQQETMRDAARGLTVQPIAFVAGEEKIADPGQRHLQRPRLFYRRELEDQPLVIARTPVRP